MRKNSSALKKYRRIYRILDFISISLFLYTIFILFNMGDVFAMDSTFELYTGSTYQFLGYEIPFESMGLMVVSVVLSLIITVVLHIRDEKTDAIKLIEKKYPRLHERLSTAYDNRAVSNIIVDSLMKNVLDDVGTVRSSSLMNKRKVLIGIAAFVFASSMFTYVTVSGYHTDISPQDLPKILENLPLIPEGEQKEVPQELFPVGVGDGEEGDGENLFGEPAIIVVEGKEIDLTLPPGAGVGFSIREEGEKRTEDFQRSSAYDISVISSQAYYENLPEGYQNIIKTYFEEIAKE
ncbi:MAG: hypothetical protein JXA98_05600 [Methanosarcinaceae archaeon]|nr:hypothetical protein [Methanosarcinaceae archaeon]